MSLWKGSRNTNALYLKISLTSAEAPKKHKHSGIITKLVSSSKIYQKHSA